MDLHGVEPYITIVARSPKRGLIRVRPSARPVNPVHILPACSAESRLSAGP
ncbi:Uncharacterised protein [Mycobacterium tuberculosis]|nr:Uncharacterised protein [Mycobacterium tuberculosis]